MSSVIAETEVHWITRLLDPSQSAPDCLLADGNGFPGVTCWVHQRGSVFIGKQVWPDSVQFTIRQAAPPGCWRWGILIERHRLGAAAFVIVLDQPFGWGLSVCWRRPAFSLLKKIWTPSLSNWEFIKHLIAWVSGSRLQTGTHRNQQTGRIMLWYRCLCFPSVPNNTNNSNNRNNSKQPTPAQPSPDQQQPPTSTRPLQQICTLVRNYH